MIIDKLTTDKMSMYEVTGQNNCRQNDYRKMTLKNYFL